MSYIQKLYEDYMDRLTKEEMCKVEPIFIDIRDAVLTPESVLYDEYKRELSERERCKCVKMSRMAELWEELYGDKPIEKVDLSAKDEIKLLGLSEKERCKEYGISCSFGICDECE